MKTRVGYIDSAVLLLIILSIMLLFYAPGVSAVIFESAAETKVTALDATAGNWFGWSVSVSGDTAIVGVPFDDENGSASGSAYIFVYDGSAWIEEAKLTASDAAAADFFGVSVSISGDTAIVGAFKADSSGAAYIFVRNGTEWIEDAKLTAGDATAGQEFGWSVSISGDTAIVGVPSDDYRNVNAGAAYIFAYDGTAWIEEAKLTASDAAAADFFGISVSVSGDTAVIGAYMTDEGGVDAGSAYVFVYDGTAWIEEAKLTASDAAAADLFGISVSISGNTVVVGAPFDDGNGSASGSAYVFVYDGTAWIEGAKLTASDAAAGDNFGNTVSISGGTVVIGAYMNNSGGINAGSAYAYVSDEADELSIEIFIDIKPDSCRNPLNVKSKGLLPVAVLGSGNLDVQDIDLSSIRLAGVAPVRSSTEDVSSLLFDEQEALVCSSEGPDGYTDLLLKFDTEHIVIALGDAVPGEERVITITGALLDGTPFEGRDHITVLSNGPKKNKK